MAPTNVTLSMSRFADFVVSDPLGQLAKLREIQRQYQKPYRPGEDFWSRWREAVEQLHRSDGTRQDLASATATAISRRREQYRSAADGYGRFWGRKRIEVVAFPRPRDWVHQTLTVRVNPEWVVRVNGEVVVMKLHLKRNLPLNQRLANPLLRLLDVQFGPEVDGPEVGVLDVHRGRLWRAGAMPSDIDTVLEMQAAALIAGWRQLNSGLGAA